MKALPKALISRWPAPMSYLAHRPWWRHVEGRELRRTDGFSLYQEPDPCAWLLIVPAPLGAPPGVQAHPVFLSGDLPDVLRRVDEEYPLPHPGLRSGQVWATVQVLEGQEEPHVHEMQIANYNRTYGYCASAADYRVSEMFLVVTSGGTQRLGRGGLQRLLEGWWLVADPGPFHQAPWAPVDTTP